MCLIISSQKEYLHDEQTFSNKPSYGFIYLQVSEIASTQLLLSIF